MNDEIILAAVLKNQSGDQKRAGRDADVSRTSFVKNNNLLLIYLWLCWVFAAVHTLSLAAVTRATLHCSADYSFQ